MIFGHHDALARVRRCRAEKQVIIFHVAQSAGEVADGEIMTMPFGTATLVQDRAGHAGTIGAHDAHRRHRR
jgi:hypothetical protein